MGGLGGKLVCPPEGLGKGVLPHKLQHKLHAACNVRPMSRGDEKRPVPPGTHRRPHGVPIEHLSLIHI